jgi:hypothetical protein
LGDLDFLEGELYFTDGDGMQYIKTIQIQTDKKKRDIQKSSKFWSSLFD